MTTQHGSEEIDDRRDWRGVDEGWGRRAVDPATLSEPANCREEIVVQIVW